MKTILSLIITGLLVVFGHAQTRNVLVGTNNAVVQPTNFWSADASNARIGLGLGTAATSPASSFQPSSSVLTNLSANDGSSLTNVSASNIVGALSIGRGGTGSTNATDARAALGLGTSATNPSSAFQPSSGTLSNLASNNAVNLTNLRAANIVGIIPSSNIPAITLTNISGVLGIVSGGTGATNTSNARINLGATTIGDALFIATNAASARTVIGALATNGNGFGLTNLNASNITGLIPASNISSVAISNIVGTLAVSSGGTGATNAGGARTNLGLGALNNVVFGSVDANLDAGGGSNAIVFNSAIEFDDIHTEDIVSVTRTNLGLGATWLTNTNVTNFRTAIGLGVSNNVQFAEVIAPAISAGLGTNSYFTANSEFIEVTLPIEFAMDSSVGTRANLGLGWSGLTNTSAATFRSALEIGTTNTLTIAGITAQNFIVTAGGGITLQSTLTNAASFRTNIGLGATWLTNTNIASFRTAIGLGSFSSDNGYSVIYGQGQEEVLNTEDGVGLFREIYFLGTNAANSAAITRASLGLGAAWLTNTNNPVFVSTNGEVVSPTNFWQAAPIQTLVQDFTGIAASQTNNATNARNVYIYSFNTNVSGISNTIILPTNTLTFNGDEVTVVHKGTTNTTTVIRQAGSTNNLITINRLDESVKFIRELGQWDFYHNISFVEPIQFSGINATANAAASRTNLGLGWPALTNSNAATVLLGLDTNSKIVTGRTNTIEFSNVTSWGGDFTIGANGEFSYGGTLVFEPETQIWFTDFEFSNTTNAATTRTNLGLGLPALTNTSVTNFQKAIFYTNTAPSNVGGNLGTIAAWIEIVASNGVTYKIPAYTNVP